ncbi:MAG: hypothetical protein ISS57_12590 [Anaerolineales bacterium]|nr:hypothetical protein [Anaerolineales bacterium]
MENSSIEENKEKSNWFTFPVIALLLIVAWYRVRLGVFTIQPLGAFPEGIAVVYRSRNPEMPFFSSPDGLCLEIR